MFYTNQPVNHWAIKVGSSFGSLIPIANALFSIFIDEVDKFSHGQVSSQIKISLIAVRYSPLDTSLRLAQPKSAFLKVSQLIVYPYTPYSVVFMHNNSGLFSSVWVLFIYSPHQVSKRGATFRETGNWPRSSIGLDIGSASATPSLSPPPCSNPHSGLRASRIFHSHPYSDTIQTRLVRE